jgi:CO/xanthine dehydrogenase FAD-binding subunit
MGVVTAYWRPDTVQGALELLARAGAIPIGGGTTVNATPAAGPREIVDLQALGLDAIRQSAAAVSIGATATLQRIADDPAVPALIRDAARREAPSTLRAAATLGGCAASGHWESELLATMLAYAAVVRLAGPDGERELSLEELLADRSPLAGRIIVSVGVAIGGVATAARTGRTAADRPIVAVVARRAAGEIWLAASGVAATPVLAPRAGADLAGWLAQLDPPGDFRGSAGYRRAVAATLAHRALEATR